MNLLISIGVYVGSNPTLSATHFANRFRDLSHSGIPYWQTTSKFRGLWGTNHDQSRAIHPCNLDEICGANIGNRDACSGSFFHRLFDGVNVGFRRPLQPRGVHAQHHLDAVTVLLRNPEQVRSQH